MDPDFTYRKRLDLDLSQFVGECVSVIKMEIPSVPYPWVSARVLFLAKWTLEGPGYPFRRSY